MRTLIAALAIVSLTAPALCQEMPGGNKHRGAAPKTEQPKNKADEKDYKAALERVPTSGQKYDPWQTMRPDERKH
jgi:hypothetical protein